MLLLHPTDISLIIHTFGFGMYFMNILVETVFAVYFLCSVCLVPIDPCAQWVYEADKVHRPMSNMGL